MSQENVEIVRRMVEAFNARQGSEELLAPDVRIENVKTAVTDNVYVGWEGARQWQRDFFGVLDEKARLEIEEIIDAGNDCVVVMLCLAGHGSKSGAPFELRWPNVVWVREGLIRRAVGYSGKSEALEAAGLSE